MYEITRFLKVGNSIIFLTSTVLAKQNTSVGQARGLPVCTLCPWGDLLGGEGRRWAPDLNCGHFWTLDSHLPWGFRAHVCTSRV